MRKVIRYGIFETNSSSTHTVSVRGKWDNKSYYCPDNIIKIGIGEYGWYGDPCDDFYSKLAYAVCMVLMTEYPNFDYYREDFIVNQKILEECQGYKVLIEAINKHGECEKIIVKKTRRLLSIWIHRPSELRRL